jgi:cell division inhibitor SepF
MSAFRRMMTYLGLVDDDEYDEYEPFEESQPGALSRPMRAGEVMEPQPGLRAMTPHGAIDPTSGVTVQPRSVVRPIIPTQSSKPHTVAPASFADCQEIADRFKAGVPVIVNLQTVERELMRRIVDFISGLTYGLGGEMEKTADRVFLLTPTMLAGSARS